MHNVINFITSINLLKVNNAKYECMIVNKLQICISSVILLIKLLMQNYTVWLHRLINLYKLSTFIYGNLINHIYFTFESDL